MIKRTTIAALSLSATALVALVAREGYTDRAIIPTEGDKPTVGFGSTVREDGTPVRMGDRTTPPKALARSLAHIQKDETGIKRCVRSPLYQIEYDTMVDFAYQYGVDRLCKSSMVRLANAGEYEASCRAYSGYRFAGGYDCSTLIDGVPNKRCWDVWGRALWRRDACLGAPAATAATADAVRPGGGAR